MKKVVLTFDDGYVSHFNVVRPVLKKYEFGSTHFISYGNEVGAKKNIMTWGQIKILHQEGFEIGNHLFVHQNMAGKKPAWNRLHIRKMEELFEQHGITKPVSFCYPGYHVDDSVIKTVGEMGYIFARSGCDKTTEFDCYQSGGSGRGFSQDDRDLLNINCTCVFGQSYQFNNFVQDLKRLQSNEIAVVCFHDIDSKAKTSISLQTFNDCMNYLHNNGYKGVALRDILVAGA